MGEKFRTENKLKMGRRKRSKILKRNLKKNIKNSK
jgi:hypothetical protein